MKDLENNLRKALERREPPDGFAEKVLARLRPEPPRQRGWREALSMLIRLPKLRWAAAGAVACLLLTLGALHYRRVERERAAGEAAKAQVMQALHIASSKLNVAMKKVQEADRRPPRT